MRARPFSYASILFIGTTLLSLATFYCPGVGAYKWFKGPAHTWTAHDDAAAGGGLRSSGGSDTARAKDADKSTASSGVVVNMMEPRVDSATL